MGKQKPKNVKDSAIDAALNKKLNRLGKQAARKENSKKKANAWRDHWNEFDKQLRLFGLMLRDVKPDGNCLFRSVGDQMEGNENNHAIYRAKTVQFMQTVPEDFSPFVEGDFGAYCKKMAKDATWGGNLELAALSRVYNTHITIYQHNAPRFEIRCEQPSAPTIHLAYHDEEHYSSVRAEGDISYTPAEIQIKAPRAPKSVVETKAIDPSTLSKSETIVSQTTGCQNLVLIKQSLQDNLGDVDATIEYLITLKALGDEEFWGQSSADKAPERKIQAAPAPPPPALPSADSKSRTFSSVSSSSSLCLSSSSSHSSSCSSSSSASKLSGPPGLSNQSVSLPIVSSTVPVPTNTPFSSHSVSCQSFASLSNSFSSSSAPLSILVSSSTSSPFASSISSPAYLLSSASSVPSSAATVSVLADDSKFCSETNDGWGDSEFVSSSWESPMFDANQDPSAVALADDFANFDLDSTGDDVKTLVANSCPSSNPDSSAALPNVSGSSPAPLATTGSNSLCSCGSGKKARRCCANRKAQRNLQEVENDIRWKKVKSRAPARAKELSLNSKQRKDLAKQRKKDALKAPASVDNTVPKDYGSVLI